MDRQQNRNLEYYIIDNIEEIIQNHIKMKLAQISNASVSEVLKLENDINFINNYKDCETRIDNLLVVQYHEKLEEKLNQEIPE